ncbi:hypothetical protein, partial [Phocaeicola sp.]|uniref:hypothetical protein n=1 Tax=Phocaeicola sp. TaxID=2773926 RepID=UPI003077AD37
FLQTQKRPSQIIFQFETASDKMAYEVIMVYHLHMPFSLLGDLPKRLFIVNFHLQYNRKEK